MKLYKAKGQGIFVNNILRIDTIGSLDNDILLVKYKDGSEAVVDNYNIIADPKAKMEKVSELIYKLPKITDRLQDNISINDIQIGDIIEIDGDVVIVDENISNMIKSNITTNILDILGDGSCIACYTFDGNANDLSGNFNGTWNGTEAYADGKFGQAALKNNTNEATSIALSNDIIFNNESFSISCWIKLFDNSSYNGLFLGCRDRNKAKSYIWIKPDSNFIEITDNNENVYQLDYVYTVNTLIHLCIVSSKEDNKISFFIDNKKIGEVNGYVVSYTIDELLGCYASAYYTHFNGLIDQVRIFNKALTEDEVKKVYQESFKLIKKII